MSRKSYPTDLTDEQWERLAPLLPNPESGTPPGGHPVVVDRREVVDATFYLLRSGTAWRMLPHDFPPWQTVYTRFRLWRLDVTWEKVHARLREEVRSGAGAAPEPATLRVDTQTVRTAQGGPQGYDGGKKGEGPQAVHRGRFPRVGVGAVGGDGRRPGPGRRAVATGRGAPPVAAGA
ncbi:MAG: IS5 family transposase [Gemmataceae bacterium]|nr:IS5 family transposase [Gemmataceae bacterium]